MATTTRLEVLHTREQLKTAWDEGEGESEGVCEGGSDYKLPRQAWWYKGDGKSAGGIGVRVRF